MEQTKRLDRKIDKGKMKNIVKKFLSAIVAVFFAIGFIAPSVAADSNLVTGDIGDYGAWTTEHNREELIGTIRHDIDEFRSAYEREYVDTGIPIEAKLGVLFISGLSYVAKVLDSALVRFVEIFLIVAFLFWVMFEAYRIIKEDKVKAMPTVQDIFLKGITLVIWLLVLGFGLSELFAQIMGPIMAFGSYLSNLILDTVSQTGGFVLSDTCAAIKAYASEHVTNSSILSADAASEIMCVPTRMSGFYYGAIKFGWQMMGAGLGTSTFTFLAGLVFVILFTYTAFKFAFVAFGVIADLFLVIILLPFTALSENLHKTSYKGIAADIYNGFLGLFKPFDLSSQIRKFIDAAVYFVALAIAVSIGGALLAMGIQLNANTHTIMIVNGDVITLLLTGALVAYIATHVDDIAKQIGGAIDSAMGSELSKDVKNLYNGTKKKATEFIKALKTKS